jgi:hypothetical protein
MAHLYKEKRTCNCGFGTLNRGAWSTHKKSCRHDVIKNDKDETISILKQQLAAKDRQIAAQAEEIKMLIKKPRTVTNNTTNRYVVEQHINVFGKETLSHISHEQIQSLLTDPENAVAKFVKLKHREPSNANVRCPNVNRAIYQVVVDAGLEGEKEWENRAKGEVLEKLYDDNSSILEGEAIEEEHMPFLDHQDRVKASAAANAADGGRCYKQQLDKIHNVISK